MSDKIKHSGACHCGAVTFEVQAPAEIDVLSCTCSMCAMTGFLHLILEDEDFEITSGADNLTDYRFNTGTARHLFCKTCGIKPFYVPRSHPDGWSVNANCLDKSTVKNMNVSEFDGANWEDNINSIR
ncbi:MAG: GFA family protein [Kordiimonadaceae bacterium]|nr:GFA family protein [Kordiimonadaceae bacterium]MBO6567898.1 GFA family protein [Kordiimonadaceae bacterium]MBO6964372.1 GFA family protein [Kordiimonadaceae bacterium]